MFLHDFHLAALPIRWRPPESRCIRGAFKTRGVPPQEIFSCSFSKTPPVSPSHSLSTSSAHSSQDVALYPPGYRFLSFGRQSHKPLILLPPLTARTVSRLAFILSNKQSSFDHLSRHHQAVTFSARQEFDKTDALITRSPTHPSEQDLVITSVTRVRPANK